MHPKVVNCKPGLELNFNPEALRQHLQENPSLESLDNKIQILKKGAICASFNRAASVFSLCSSDQESNGPIHHKAFDPSYL